MSNKNTEVSYIDFNTIFHPYTSSIFVDTFNRIHDSNQPIIPIRINSPGGYVIALQEILDVIDSSEKPIATFATGLAASCGATLSVCGSDGLRFIAPNCEFMIHQVSGGTRGKAADIEAESKLVNEMLDRFVYSRLDKAAHKEAGYTRNLIKENFNADLSMFGEEAIAHGYFNELGTINMCKDMNLLMQKHKQCNMSKKI